MLQSSLATATGASLLGAFAPLFAGSEERRFKVGACDWSIGKMGNPESFAVAKEIGLDGVQVSLGTASDDMKLRRAEVQRQFKEAASKAGVEVASLAIGELNNIPYKSDPRTIPWVNDSAAACRAMGCKVVLLAFFGNGDLRGDAAGKAEVVRRLQEAAKKAEDAGVILGIESWLSAEEHLEIIDKVGSKSVQVYYDVCNSNDRGYDIYREIRMLGPRICEFHAKENGALLGKGKVDFQKVREAMDDIKYRGWIQIEGAVPSGGDTVASYKENNRFLRSVLT